VIHSSFIISGGFCAFDSSLYCGRPWNKTVVRLGPRIEIKVKIRRVPSA
jgi:hypothetical protein